MILMFTKMMSLKVLLSSVSLGDMVCYSAVAGGVQWKDGNPRAPGGLTTCLAIGVWKEF